MHPQRDSKCVECGEPAPPAAPMGLCVDCFQKSTGLGADEYHRSTTFDPAATLPTRPVSNRGSGSESPPQALRPDRTLGQGRFTLIRRLGKGGMGEVWLASDRDLTEGSAPFVVALKFLASEIRHDPEKLNWLRREVLASRGLNHDNIVKVFDLHASSPTEPAFLAMEYVEGTTLEDRLLRKPKHFFPWDDLCPFARQICAALEYAHDRGVFHRDLKPRNILVASNSDETKLADFGLARRLATGESSGTQFGSGAGTRGYMSPQQAAGHRPTRFDDIYALGATLYHLLTGELPQFREAKAGGKSPWSLVPMSERLAAKGPFRVPDQVERIVRQCLEEEPLDRPGTVYEVAAGLGFTSLPNVSRPAPVGPPKSSKSGTLKRALSALIGLGVLLGLLVFVVLQPEFREFLDRVVPRRQPVPPRKESASSTAPSTSPAPAPPTPTTATPPASGASTAGPTSTAATPSPTLGSEVAASPSPVTPTAPVAVTPPKTSEPELRPPEIAKTESTATPSSEPRAGTRWTNSIGMEFLPVPELRVLVSRFETRLSDYRRLVPKHPAASFQTVGASNHPMVDVTWFQATNFCHWLTTQERKAGLLGEQQRYRLPTVAEWMKAAGTPSPVAESSAANPAGPRPTTFLWGTNWPPPPTIGNLLGDETQGISVFANREDRIRRRQDGSAFTATVGTYAANAYGLSDMTGNVWELCADGPSSNQCWSVGGSFNTGARKELTVGFRRVNARRREHQTDDWDTGFRCVLDPGPAAGPDPDRPNRP